VNRFVKKFIQNATDVDSIVQHKKYAVIKLIKQRIDELVRLEYKFVADTVDEGYNKAISKVMMKNFLKRPESCIKITLAELIDLGYEFKEQY
jgi:hypothetical protein